MLIISRLDNHNHSDKNIGRNRNNNKMSVFETTVCCRMLFVNNDEIQLPNWRSISIVITGLEYNEMSSLPALLTVKMPMIISELCEKHESTV